MASEFTPRGRIVRIIIDLLDKQVGYTKKELMAKYDKSEDSILEDISTLRLAGFIIEADKKHRYAFKENKPYKQLKNLLHFSEDDKFLLERAIDQISPHTKSGDRLKRKLSALSSGVCPQLLSACGAYIASTGRPSVNTPSDQCMSLHFS